MVVQVISLHERENRVFAREDLVQADGSSRILPESRDLTAFEIRDTPFGFILQPKGIIGYLPLTRDIALNLRPKFPLDNLWRMLAIADEEYNRLVPILRSYGDFRESPPHLMLVRSFCYFLSEIMTEGIARGYVATDFRGTFRPKPNFSKTASRFLSRGNIISVEGEEFIFSPRLGANKVLKQACIDFMRLIPNEPSWQPERHLLLDALNCLDSVRPFKMLPDDIELSESLSSWLRVAYRRALHVYSVYCGHNYLGFSFEAKGAPLPSFLFKLDDIFEAFIRNALRSAMAGLGVNVLDGNQSKHQSRLFSDNSRFKVQPDVIFKRGRSIELIAEVKYKPKIEEVDRYQLLGHVLATDAHIGVWISPTTDATSAGLEYVGTQARKRFYHYRIDLTRDIDDGIKKLTNQMASLMSTTSNRRENIAIS